MNNETFEVEGIPLDRDNREFNLALDYVLHTRQTIYLTGKAGTGWYPEKQMKGVRGGFIKGESFTKDDTPLYLHNNALTYELTLQRHGNFQTSSSSEGEMF